VDFIAANTKTNPNAAFAGSVPYLMLAGNLMAGWQLARSMMAALDHMAEDPAFMQAKVTTARFYADHMLTKAPGMREGIVEGAEGVTSMNIAAF
jgi:3-(methylthio)propanoyl-CoA dehydrogenase